MVNGHYALLFRNIYIFGVHCEYLNEDRPTLSPAKMETNNSSCYRFTSVPFRREGLSNDSGAVDNGNFQYTVTRYFFGIFQVRPSAVTVGLQWTMSASFKAKTPLRHRVVSSRQRGFLVLECWHCDHSITNETWSVCDILIHEQTSVRDSLTLTRLHHWSSAVGYPTVHRQWPGFSGRRCSCSEQSASTRHLLTLCGCLSVPS